MIDVSFPKRRHLRRRVDFERVYEQRCKGADGTLLVFVCRNDLNETRLGCSVAKKHGSAVVRNRLKRWLREAFRLEHDNFPQSIDLIAIPLDAQKASLNSYRDSLSKLVARLSRRLAPSITDQKSTSNRDDIEERS